MTDEEINIACKARGWLTLNEMIEPGPLDFLFAHTAVNSLEKLSQWVSMERATYLRLHICHELGVRLLTDEQHEDILGKLAMLHSFHANVRQVMNAV